MIQSFLLLVAAIFGLLLPVLTQHKPDKRNMTEIACVADSRATKTTKHAKGTTEDALVQQCGNEAGAAQTAAGSQAPSTNGAAAAPQKPSRTLARVEKRRVPDRHGRNLARRKIESASPMASVESERKFPAESAFR